MKLEIKNNNNYAAVIVKLPKTNSVNGLDNLVKVNIFGNDCLVSKDSKEGELYVYLPAECQLSEEFCRHNNLFRHNEFNNDKDKKGFFEDTRRVKAIKFKGVLSSCFVIPIDSLSYLCDISKLKVGDEFDTIDGKEVCKKFVKGLEKFATFSAKRQHQKKIAPKKRTITKRGNV